MIKGSHHKPEVKQQISNSLKGKMAGEKNPMYGKKGILNPFYDHHHTAEAKEKLRQSHLGKSKYWSGKHHSEETKQKLRDLNLGKKSAFKGKHHTAEAKEKIRQARLGKPTFTGRQHSNETKEKIRNAHIKENLSLETITKMRNAKLGKPHSMEHKRKIGEASKILWKNPEYVIKVLKGQRSKTRPEKQLDKLLQSLYPNEFKYNGGFECGITIDGLIPDFVNVNGKKQVIELFGDHWHEDTDEDEKRQRYAKCGFDSLYIWESDLKQSRSEVIKAISVFVDK